MLRLLVLSLFCINSCKVVGQIPVTDKTIKSNIVVTYNKVTPSFKEANKAYMNTAYLLEKKMVILTFEVPSFWLRAKTSLEDFCIIKTNYGDVKLQNKMESYSNGLDMIGNYTFSFSISKDSLLMLLKSDFKKLNFYFTPNEAIKKITNEDENKSNNLVKYATKLSKKTLILRVKKPDTNKYLELINWLNSL